MIDAAQWDAERARLTGVAYRMLGSAADAEDVVQEALLRATQAPPLESPRAWLTTVVTRLCLDTLRSARRRRTTYVGTWLPEPVATDAPLADARLVETESLSLGLLRLLQTLSPLERAVFVLHEVMDTPMPEVSVALGRSEAACRQLLHRARGHVASGRLRRPSPAEADRVVVALMTALAQGDLDALQGLLLADVRAESDHGGKASAIQRAVTGVDAVARLLLGLAAKLARTGAETRAVWLNGAMGLVVVESGAVTTAVLPEVMATAEGAGVSAVWMVRNPDKLAGLTAALRDGRVHAWTMG